ncbi:Transcription elongation factor spt5 [Smittium culicis]|uniref:Chromatin elongation factor SPT5 n=1 Tax=Smittium culicis TaxID=133412 RepID=A0A1R1Y006_9FUNG|nr:Transcription elongation factor spt5 [Smittium culicis]
MSSDIGEDGFEAELKKLKKSYKETNVDDSDGIQSQDEDSDHIMQKRTLSSNKNSRNSSSRRNKHSKRRYDDEDSINSDSNDYSEEEEEEYSSKSKNKKKRRRRGGNMFLDVEAAVDTDDEEEDDDGDLGGDFIADDEAELAEAEQMAMQSHRRYSALPQDREEEDVEEIAARLKSRYENYGSKKSFVSTAEHVPKQFLLPGVQDPHLFMVRCSMGKERDVVFQLMRRCVEKAEAGQQIRILSAYCRNGLSGYVYLEANTQADAQSALERTAGVLSMKLMLVPIDQMVDVIRVKKKDKTIQPGAWVRVKRGKYAGDLAQVLAIIDSTDSAELKLVPRIEYDEIVDEEGKKKKPIGFQSQTVRPPQKLFDPREAERIDMNKPVIPRGSDIFHWGGDIFNKGYLEKEFKLVSLQTEKVNPTLEEITIFSGGDSEALAEAAAAAASAASAIGDSGDGSKNDNVDLVIGDNVEVIEGDLIGVVGTVTAVDNDGILRVQLSMDKLAPSYSRNNRNTVMSFRSRQLRKLFREGDHAKVLRGKHKGITGSVVSVDGMIVTLVSDLSLTELKVFARDICQSKEVSSQADSGDFDKNELITLDGGRTVAIILASEKGLYKVLDQNGEASTIKSYEATKSRNRQDFNVVYDSNRNEIKVGDIVREINGGSRSGTIIQLSRFVAFVRSDNVPENGGIFVSRVRNLVSTTPTRETLNPFGNQKIVAKKFRPQQNFARGRDQAKGKVVMIVRGSFKGYMGVIKESSGLMARVELHTSAKIVNVERDKLMVKLPDGRTVPLDYNPGGNEGGGNNGYNDRNSSRDRPNSRAGYRDQGSFAAPSTPSSFPSTPGNSGSFGNSWGNSSGVVSTPSSTWGSGAGGATSNDNAFSGSWGSDSSTDKNSSGAWGSDSSTNDAASGTWGSASSKESSSGAAWGSGESSENKPEPTWGSSESTEKSSGPAWGSSEPSQKPSEPAWGSSESTEKSSGSTWGASESTKNAPSNSWGGGASTSTTESSAWGVGNSIPDKSKNINAWDSNSTSDATQGNSWGSSSESNKHDTSNSWGSGGGGAESKWGDAEKSSTATSAWGADSVSSGQGSSQQWGSQDVGKNENSNSWDSSAGSAQGNANSNSWGNSSSFSNNSFADNSDSGNALPQTPMSTWDNNHSSEYSSRGGRGGGRNGSFNNDRRGSERSSYSSYGESRGRGGHSSYGESRGRGGHSSYGESRGRGGHSSYGESRGRGGHSSYGESRGRGGRGSYGDNRGRGGYSSYGDSRGRGGGRGGGYNSHDRNGGDRGSYGNNNFNDRPFNTHNSGGNNRDSSFEVPQTPGVQAPGFGNNSFPETPGNTSSFNTWGAPGSPNNNVDTSNSGGWGQPSNTSSNSEAWPQAS